MISETSNNSEWTGLRGRIMAWYLNSPFRRLSEVLFLGDGRSRVLAEVTAALKGEGTVLDVGAGSGYFSLAIAQKLKQGKVICLDLSKEMLQRLRQLANKRGLADKVQMLEGSASRIMLDDGVVDVAIANGVFHELVDPAVVLQEMVRVLRPGGAIIVTDFRADTWIGRRVASAHRSEDHGPFGRQELEKLFLDVSLRDVRVSAVRHIVVGVGIKAEAA
ncbi:MAG: class I SAM-dependent methyltransferase [Chloroflexi bacterium]|nr:class I SAM-dependent methyltransferase [Chloroflexota bacterium]